MDRKRYLKQIEQVIRDGKYHADWESLAEHPIPAWYRELRLGIFLHWGPFSVPAYHDWYARNMYIQDSPEYRHHLQVYGDHKEHGYKSFIPAFTMEQFSPAQWVDLFRAAGADYIVPVAEHHDGFQNYRSELSAWNAVEKGPHRDIMGDLLLEGEKAGMMRGASSHRVEHWWFLGNGREFDSDVNSCQDKDDLYWPARKEPANQHDLYGEPAPDEAFLEDWLLRSCEIVDRYHPRVFYFDWWIQHSAVKSWLMKFAAYYFNRAESWGGCVINYKHDAFPWGIGVPDIERGQFAEAKPFLWQSDTSVMRNSWCYSRFADYKAPIEILWDLIDVVSKNGRLLLNFGPRPDGTLTEKDLEILEVLKNWMRINDEAIHAAGLWRVSQEGPTRVEEGQFADSKSRGFTSDDIRFTCRGPYIYAIAMRFPENRELCIRSLRKADASRLPLWHGIIQEVEALGYGPVKWRRDEEGLHVRFKQEDAGDYPVVIRVKTT